MTSTRFNRRLEARTIRRSAFGPPHPIMGLVIGRLMGLVIGLVLSGLLPQIARAAPSAEVRIELITVGPGDALFTRAGHAALAVVEAWPDGREMTTVYNYGDADFGDPWLGPRFIFGVARFRLAISGDLYDTVEFYGPMQNRDVFRQRLALTTMQAGRVAAALQHTVLPENREYPYHYLRRTCTTELRTLLDEVLGGTIHAQLSDPDPWTVRDYQQLTFDGDIATALLGDAVFGRAHEAQIDRFFAMMWPDRMRAYLQDVIVADPAGGGAMVPLASAPELLAERGGQPATVSPTRITYWFAPIAATLVMLGALGLRRRSTTPTRLHGLWLLMWSLPLGAVGLLITLLSVASSVPELGDNELVLSLLATDLVLVSPGIAWLRGKTSVPRWLGRYAQVRLAVVGVATALHVVGVFVQQPWVIPPASLLCSVALWWLAAGLSPRAQTDK
ncbi:MAG: DUF4105 domain-containing protein [Nannocystaceae bacterium]|nr:DUF4105 domain-containing protein [Nannocystaceae bacterium]